MARVRVGLLVRVQDASGEARLARDDRRQQALAGRAVRQRAGLDGTAVEQAEGGGGQRQFEVVAGVGDDRDGAHRQGGGDVQVRPVGEHGPPGLPGGAQRLVQRGAHGERVHGQGDVRPGQAGQPEPGRGGPPRRERRGAPYGECGGREGQPTQLEGRVELRRVRS